jgi:hypothetical protein
MLIPTMMILLEIAGYVGAAVATAATILLLVIFLFPIHCLYWALLIWWWIGRG